MTCVQNTHTFLKHIHLSISTTGTYSGWKSLRSLAKKQWPIAMTNAMWYCYCCYYYHYFFSFVEQVYFFWIELPGRPGPHSKRIRYSITNYKVLQQLYVFVPFFWSHSSSSCKHHNDMCTKYSSRSIHSTYTYTLGTYRNRIFYKPDALPVSKPKA